MYLNFRKKPFLNKANYTLKFHKVQSKMSSIRKTHRMNECRVKETYANIEQIVIMSV